MFKTPHSAAFFAASLHLSAGFLAGGGRAAAADGKIKSMSLDLAVSTGAAHVISRDGKKWSAIKPTELGISGPISAKMKTGYISSYHLLLGVCGNDAQCNQAFPVI
jgi:hypothetical protein